MENEETYQGSNLLKGDSIYDCMHQKIVGVPYMLKTCTNMVIMTYLSIVWISPCLLACLMYM